MDIKYLPQMPDETTRRYLFVAIDRASRWVFFRIYSDQSDESSVDFLHALHQAAPMVIQKVLTDNGCQFTDRFTCKEKKPFGEHDFDKAFPWGSNIGCHRQSIHKAMAWLSGSMVESVSW